MFAMRLFLVALCLQPSASQPHPALAQLPQGWREPEAAVALEEQVEAEYLLQMSFSLPKKATLAEPPLSLALNTLEASASSSVPCGSSWMLRAACMVAVCLFFLVSTGLLPARYGTPEIALITQACAMGIGYLSFTVVIPSSYSMAKVVGLGAAYSGLLISLYQLGVCASAVLMWVAAWLLPDVWRASLPLMVAGTCFNLLGATLYFVLSVAAEPFTSGEPVEHTRPWMAIPLIISRLLDGFGAGVILQLGQMLIVHVMPKEQRATWMVSNSFAAMLGIGLGPMVSSAMSALNLCHRSTGQLAAVGVGYLGLAVSSTLLVLTRFPRNLREEVTDHQPPTHSAVASGTEATTDDARSRIILILGSLIMCVLRSYVISGLEAATSFLLEVEYGWGLAPTGIAVGLCFLLCVPVKLLYNAFEDRLSLTTWVRVSSIGAVAGGLLLFRWSDSALVLLVGDALVFPTLFLGDAIAAGIMFMHLLPEGSWFSPNQVVLQRTLFMCLGRNLGPPLARMIVHDSGQNGYAAQQLALAVLFLVVLETCVTPHAKLSGAPKEKR